MAKSDKYRIKNKEKREKLLNYLLDEFGRVLASAESKTTNKTTAKSKSKTKSKSKSKSKKGKRKSTGKKKTTNKTTAKSKSKTKSKSKSKSKSKKSKKRRFPKGAPSYAKKAARIKKNWGHTVVVVEHQAPTPETSRGMKLDEDHDAEPPGWRVSIRGNLYYEDRRNRSDLPGKKI